MDSEAKLFLDAAHYYDAFSLNILTVLTTQTWHDDAEKDTNAAIRRLLARILCTFSECTGAHKIDFSNLTEIGMVGNSLFPFLRKRYLDSYNALSSLADEGSISEKQFLYELAFQKTYPRIFVENIADRLKPFHDFLAKYGTNESDISNGLTSLIIQLSRPKNILEMVTPQTFNMGGYLKRSLLKALSEANEKISSLENINPFSKEPFFPVRKMEGMYCLLHSETLIDSFYKTVHRLCMNSSNQKEKDILMSAKGRNFNEMCFRLFRFGFGFDSVYENLSYSKGEIDLLIVDKDCLFVIECKSRNYTDKISGLSPNYRKANQSNLDQASKQLDRFLTVFSHDESVAMKTNTGDTVRLRRRDYAIIIPLVINLDNFAELNADYDSRDSNCVYISYDDLTIIHDVIGHRKWLLVDFLYQLKELARPGAAADDIIDMFAFYGQCKNLSLLFEEKTNVIIDGLGNDYFNVYFSFATNVNPIGSFENDIATFSMCDNETYVDTIERYHQKYWRRGLK